MALYRRFEWTILNAAGEPVSGCSVEVRKQGATANAGGTLTTIAVHHVGALVAGDTVVLDATAAPSVTVNTVNGPSPMQIVVSSALTVVNDVSRLSATNLPTIYDDTDGTEAKSNPLTTDANGYAFCYAPYDFVDALIAGTNAGSAPSGGAKVRLVYDQGGQGDGTCTSSVIDTVGGTAVAYVYDTVRNLGNANSLIASWRRAGSEVARLTKDGAFSCSALTTTGTIVSTGTVFANGGLNVTGAVTLPNGSITTAFLAANAVTPAVSKTSGAASDTVIGTTETVRITTSYTPTSGNTGVIVTVNAPYYLTTGGGIETRAELRLYIGGVLKAVGLTGEGTSTGFGTIAFTHIEPAMAASPTTIEVRDIRVDTAGTGVATYKGTIYAGYLTILEFKK